MPTNDDTPPATPARAAWVRPEVECLETRPEITAYAGGSDPWNNNR